MRRPASLDLGGRFDFALGRLRLTPGSCQSARLAPLYICSCYIGCALPLREKALIARIRREAERSGPTLDGGIGIGDDCAVLRIPRGHEALVTTDFSLENVHFRRAWHPPESVGHRCLARGLSDIAAMGGEPLAAFLSPCRRACPNPGWIDSFGGW